METVVILKETGKPQRPDVELTEGIAVALAQMVLEGKPIFPGAVGASGYMSITIPGNGEEMLISRKTIHNWITRGNVLPNGIALRTLLDRARKEYRDRKEAEMDEARREIIDHKLNRALAINTREPVVGMFGVIKNPETGKPLMKENSKLLKIQMDTAQWLAERLYPDRYGKVEKSVNKHLVFSLGDLWEAEKARKKTV